MNISQLIDILPVWVIYVSTVALVLLSILCGIALARLWRKQVRDQRDGVVNTIVGAVLALLAFILAFTFGLASSRFDSRKQLLLDEVNTIGTVFLRSDFLPEPDRSEMHKLLKTYVDIRVNLISNPENISQAIKQAEELQDRMWSLARSLAQANVKNPAIAALFVSSLNEMIDLQTSRIVVTLTYRIPPPMWYALLGIIASSMVSVGYLFGSYKRINWPLIILLALVFSVVIALIADLDRSAGGKLGFTKIYQQPVLDLQKKLHEQVQ